MNSKFRQPKENPYYDITVVRDIDMFFGREQVLRKLFATIAKQQSFSLIGSLHIGKSSVLQYACRPEIQQRFHYNWAHHIFVFVDLREYKTDIQFFESVSQQILLHCREVLDLPFLSTKLDGDQSRIFSSILEQIQTHGFRLILLMDAIDSITRNQSFKPDFFTFLRGLATMGKVSYVTGSMSPLYDNCHEAIKTSPFFNIFLTHRLEALTQDEARELIVVPAQRAGILFSEQEIQWVLVQAGRHPFFIQRVCHYLFEEKYASQPLDLPHVGAQAYKDLLPHFQYTWQCLSEREQELLMHKVQVPSVPILELPELTESALFCQFLRYYSRASTFELTVEQVENALDRLNDNRALGDSPLRYLALVTQRSPTDAQTISTAERARILRELLTEAFERMRGIGPRSDNAPDWKLYNILYYRYFNRNRLKHEQIAARIACSERQYFRERIKAIETLLNELVEMEASLHSNDNA